MLILIFLKSLLLVLLFILMVLIMVRLLNQVESGIVSLVISLTGTHHIREWKYLINIMGKHLEFFLVMSIWPD